MRYVDYLAQVRIRLVQRSATHPIDSLYLYLRTMELNVAGLRERKSPRDARIPVYECDGLPAIVEE
jgi:hypothetical protein